MVKSILLYNKFLINNHFIENPIIGGSPIIEKIINNIFNLKKKFILKNFN